jgi:heme exporter protein CcmD
MIDWNADHIDFVIVAYAIVFAVLAVVVVATLLRASALKKTLADMKLPDSGQKDAT